MATFQLLSKCAFPEKAGKDAQVFLLKCRRILVHSQWNDSELLDRARRGDETAFAELISRHYAGALRWVGRIIKSQGEAEDVVQDSMIKVARSISTFEGRSSFRTWFWSILYRTALDYKRRERPDHDSESELQLKSDGVSPEEKVLIDEELLLLRKGFEALPEKMREAASLVLMEGLSHGEAAQVLNCRESTVSWQVMEARKRLKKTLEESSIPKRRAA